MTDHDGALLDRDMGLLLAAASRAVISLYRPLLKPYHLTHPQYLVMLALGWLDGSGIIWDTVPIDADRAVDQVRRHQMEQGWMPPGTV